jgi:small-conductance mechanosensitive channel
MQLTLTQTITVIYDLLHSYERKHIPADADVRRTWFYDAVYKMVVPIAATLSVGLSIYWAARVFDLTQWCEHIFRYKFVDQPGLIVLSLDRIMACVAFAFVFHYVIYLFVQGYQLWKQNRAESRAISAYERENDVNADDEINIETVIQDDPTAKAQVKAASKAVTLSMNIIKYIGWGIYIYIVLVTLHVNRTGITFILTGLSTGIGFAMKDTLENLFYGLSLMNGRVKIGDVIECDGVRGKVSNINYQSTLVETVDGSVIAFLNSQLFTKNFKNMTRNHGYEMAKITVGVAYGSKIDKVREMIIERIKLLDCYQPEKGVQVLFQNFGESSVDLLVIVWVRVASQVADIALIKENIYTVLNENDIEIPFPQADVHIRTAAVPVRP